MPGLAAEPLEPLETIYGTFTSRRELKKAYESLAERGYTNDELTVVFSEETQQREFGPAAPADAPSDPVMNPVAAETAETPGKAIEVASVGGAVGGLAGGILAALAALGTSVALPGLGVVIAGPLAAGLAGVGGGALTGGLLGAIVGWGVPEAQAEQYETSIRQGSIILGVRPHNADDAAFFAHQWNPAPETS